MKLYEVIIREFSDDETITNLAKLFSGNPIDNGISEKEFRNTFTNAVGYDPTTIYDFARIDKYVDNNKDILDGVNDPEAFKKNMKDSFVENKDDIIEGYISSFVNQTFGAGWDEDDDDYDDPLDSDDDDISDAEVDFDDYGDLSDDDD